MTKNTPPLTPYPPLFKTNKELVNKLKSKITTHFKQILKN
jgi:hypothetical protein